MLFFIYVYSKTLLYMFRTDTPFIIRSLRVTVYAAACRYQHVYSKTLLYMFRTDTPFIIRSLRITVYADACTYHAIGD